MIEGSDFGLQELLLMLGGAGVTLQITFYAVLGGTLMGLVFGLVRAVAPWWINWPLGGILDVFRSVPLLIQLVLVNSFKSILNLPASAFTVTAISCVTDWPGPAAFRTASFAWPRPFIWNTESRAASSDGPKPRTMNMPLPYAAQ